MRARYNSSSGIPRSVSLVRIMSEYRPARERANSKTDLRSLVRRSTQDSTASLNSMGSRARRSRSISARAVGTTLSPVQGDCIPGNRPSWYPKPINSATKNPPRDPHRNTHRAVAQTGRIPTIFPTANKIASYRRTTSRRPVQSTRLRLSTLLREQWNYYVRFAQQLTVC